MKKNKITQLIEREMAHQSLLDFPVIIIFYVPYQYLDRVPNDYEACLFK